MQAAHARELRLFQTGYGAQQFRLRAIFQLGLETDHVPKGSECIVLTQLDHGIGAFAGMGIGQPNRFHWSKAQCFRAA